jgi:FkbM family methyltransferase
MIDPKAVQTYAQYNEDVILLALLDGVKDGFYVDVGANYPTIDSVTKLFYERGWSGINIEPIGSLFNDLKKERPRDVNLQIGAGEKNGEATLREYVGIPGHSTFDDEQKEHEGQKEFKEYTVPIRSLQDIFDEYKPAKIDFLKVDVEGYEYQVIKGNNWSRYRPEVICIEANHIKHDWRPILEKNGYRLFIKDGLNEYYLSKEAWWRTEGFADRAVDLNYHTLKQHQWEAWSVDSKELRKLHSLASSQQALIEEKEQMIQKLLKAERLSLKDRSWPSRLKRATYGLSVDWVSYKKDNTKR